MCLARNVARDGRSVEASVIHRQSAELRATLDGPDGITREGFVAVHVVTEPLERLTVERPGRAGRSGAVASGEAGTAAGTIAPARARRPVQRRTAR